MPLFRREAPVPRNPLAERYETLQMEIAIAELEDQLARMLPEPGGMPVVSAAAGKTQASPFVEAVGHDVTPHRFAGVIPWRRRESVRGVALEATNIPNAPSAPISRRGFVEGLPIGGTTPTNSGTASTPGAPDRATAMTELLQVYLTCPWVSACVDTIARTITAGGLMISPIADPDDAAAADKKTRPPEVEKVQALFDYVNPTDDIRQLMRRVITDLLIFGDAFLEVSWMLGEPVALWPLDCQTISIIADTHGNVGRMIDGKLVGYVQTTTNGQSVNFAPNEVIHIKLDSPGASLYGVSPTSKALVPIKTWLFAAGLVKETMKRGDPPRLHIDWPITLPVSEITKSSTQYATRNLGSRNIGNPFETKGGAQITEMQPNKIEYWIDVLANTRDEICSEMGVPKRKVGIAEQGSLGGEGVENGENKTFEVNTCGPTSEILTEKISFALLYQAYGVKDYHVEFGRVDMRTDLVIEQIRDLRLRNGSWVLNRYRKDIGEGDVAGGDDAVLVDRQNLVLWSDMKALSSAAVAAKGKGTELDPNATTPEERQATAQAKLQALQKSGGIGQDQPPGTPQQGSEWIVGGGLSEQWRREWKVRRDSVLAGLSSGR